MARIANAKKQAKEYAALAAVILATTFVLIPFLIKLIFGISASHVLGTKVTAGALSFNIIRGEVNLKNIRIYQPKGFGEGVMADIPFIKAALCPLPLAGPRLCISTLTLEIPQLVVVKNDKGILNVDELRFKDYKIYVNVGEFIFSAGSVIYIDYTFKPRPKIQGYEVNIYERRYRDLPTAEDIIAKVLQDILSRTAIKGAIVFGAATAAGVSLAGPLAIPAVAGIALTEKDTAATVFNKNYDAVYEAAYQAVKKMGDVNYYNKDSGVIRGRVSGADVAISIDREERNETSVVVSARRWLLPDRQTAAGVLYEISVNVGTPGRR